MEGTAAAQQAAAQQAAAQLHRTRGSGRALSSPGVPQVRMATNGRAALWKLIRGGDVAALRAALDAGGAGLVEARDVKSGSTAFLFACMCGQVECMEVLRQAGCDVSAMSDRGPSQGQMGLHMAAAGGHAAAVRWLLAAEAELEAREKQQGNTGFLRARMHGLLECMEILPQAGCNVSAINDQGQMGLHMAAAEGHAVAVRWLLAAEAELEAREKLQGSTAFLLACLDGRVECMELLQQAGCNVSAINNQGYTGLHMAAAGHAAAVRWLLAAEVELEARDESSSTAFLFACMHGQAECMEILQQAGCNVSAMNNQGYTGLHMAAAGGHAVAVRWLLDAKVDLEAREKQQGSTAFLLACLDGRVECMQMLNDAGCDVLCELPDGRTAMDLANASGNDKAARLSIQIATERRLQGLMDKAQWTEEEEAAFADARSGMWLTDATAFLYACHRGDAELVCAVAKAFSSGDLAPGVLEARTPGGRTGLTLAAASGSAEAMQAVLELGGSELEAKDSDGATAFLLACFGGHAECVYALAEAGCDTSAKCHKGQTGLMVAARSGSVEATRAVLELGGSELETQDSDGATAFLSACLKGHAECVYALAEAGCDTSAKGPEGQTGLILAARAGSVGAVQAVLAAGDVELEARDEEGGTAFLSACFGGHAECVSALAEAGCDTTSKTPSGNTGLLLASQYQASSNSIRTQVRSR
jgi:ankyrin repeat protein